MNPRPPAIHLNILDANDRHDDDDDDLGLANDAALSSVPSLWGIPLKYLSYVLGSSASLYLSNSLQPSHPGGPKFTTHPHNALFASVYAPVACLLSSHGSAHERNIEGLHIPRHRLFTHRHSVPRPRWTDNRATQLCGSRKKTGWRCVQPRLLETLNTRDSLWSVEPPFTA